MTKVATFAYSLFHQPRPDWPEALAALHRCCETIVAHIALLAERAQEHVQEKAKELGISTQDLIRRFQRGQPWAFEALYDRFKDYVYRTAFFVTRNSGDAEEAVQETFLDVLRALPNYRVEGPARFETWLYRVTVNRCRSRLRRKRIPTDDWDEIEERLERTPETHPSYNPEGVALKQEQAIELWRAVDQLPDAQRAVVLLRYQQGFSYSEIAQALDINEGTVKSRLYHAHRKLKEQLE